MKNHKKNIALYARSVCKENSIFAPYIKMQKIKLLNYVVLYFREYNYEFYIDNGYFGLIHRLDEFERMLDDIKHDKVELILIARSSIIPEERISIIYEMKEKYGVNFISLDGKINTIQDRYYDYLKSWNSLNYSIFKQRK